MTDSSRHVLFVHAGNGTSGKLSSIPISEAYMMAYIKKSGFTCSILSDLLDKPLKKKLLKKELEEKNPMLVGFTCYEATIDRVRIWAHYIKKLNAEIKIILGGPQIQFMPGNALNHMPEVDFLCRGEGEIVLLKLCQALEINGCTSDIGGICFRNENNTHETCRPATPDSLEEYPSPYLDGTIDIRNLKKAILLTSRGCNWDCHFCYTPNATGRRVRYHSVDQVIEEMKFLKQKGVTYFWFADPLFSANPCRLKELLNRIIEEVPGITFWCECRCEVMNKEIFELMKNAGAVKVAFGLESGSQKVLKIMNKRLDLDRLSQAVRLAQKIGIEVELFSIFGLPGETFTDAMETIDYVKRHGIRISGNSGSQQMSIYFGTEFQWNFQRYGIIPDGFTKPFYKSIGRDYSTDLLSADDLTRISWIWSLQEMSNAPPEDLLLSLGRIVRHRELLSDHPVFHSVLFKAYMALEEYRLAYDSVKTLMAKFPGSEYAQSIVTDGISVFRKATGDLQQTDCVIYATESAGPTAYQVHQKNYEDLPAELKAKLVERPVKWKGTFTGNSPGGKKQNFRFEILSVLRPQIIRHLEELKIATQPVYSAKLLRNEVFDQHSLLFYFAVRSLATTAVLKDKDLTLLLVNYYLKFGLTDKAQQILKDCPSGFVPDLAEVCVLNSQSVMALNLLEKIKSRSSKLRLLKIESFIQLNRLENIENELAQVRAGNRLKLYDLWLEIISKKKLPVETYNSYVDQWMEAKLSEIQ